jgi:GntR family transcriptional repressor for pyruvate dehydrogenase complex
VAHSSLTGPVGQTVRAQKTGELIAAFLRSRIVRGELQPGDSLPSEMELMEQFQVSRPTLREAFRILETESLIVIRRGSRGARVMTPDTAVAARYVGLLLQTTGTTFADVYQARSVIEPAAAGLLASRRTKQDVADLVACADALEAVLDADSGDAQMARWPAMTQTFHDLVLDRAGNRTLALQSAVLREVIETHLALAGRRADDPVALRRQYRRTVRSYRKLIEFIDQRDAGGAEKHWATHMELAGRALLRDDLSSKTVLDLFT